MYTSEVALSSLSGIQGQLVFSDVYFGGVGFNQLEVMATLTAMSVAFLNYLP